MDVDSLGQGARKVSPAGIATPMDSRVSSTYSSDGPAAWSCSVRSACPRGAVTEVSRLAPEASLLGLPLPRAPFIWCMSVSSGATSCVCIYMYRHGQTDTHTHTHTHTHTRADLWGMGVSTGTIRTRVHTYRHRQTQADTGRHIHVPVSRASA